MKSNISKTLNAIEKNNMIFLSAQPDQIYFHWQVDVYLNNFNKFNLLKFSHTLFAVSNKPTQGLLNLMKKYKNIHWYLDERPNDQKKGYIPSLRQMLYKKFFSDYPHLGTAVFLHDSDIVFRKLPKFELLLNDNIGYLSDTVSYIGYKYLSDKSKEYKNKYQELPPNDLFLKMCHVVDVDPELVKQNQANSGGAQYLLKNINSSYFAEIEDKVYKLHAFFEKYKKKYTIDNHVQSWCNDMWVTLWVYWKNGGETKISNELSFSWGTSSKQEYYQHNILHMAGVTQKLKKGRFCKSDYTNTNILEKIKKKPNMFNYVKENASHFYVKEIEHTACGVQGCQVKDSTSWGLKEFILIIILVTFIFILLYFCLK